MALSHRVELSLAHQDFDTGQNPAPLGLCALRLKQDIVVLKLRGAGEALLDSDTWMRQLDVGARRKRADAGALGTKKSGAEFYVSATTLFSALGVLINLSLRFMQSNQGGLPGFWWRAGPWPGT